MKILITGGNGFIARHLLEQLKQEHTILAFNSSQLDLLDYRAVADCLIKGKFDIVIHAATYDAAPKHSLKDPAKVLENNLKMYFNIARCGQHFGKMFYFGSGAEFSRQNWKPKMDEGYFDCHVPADQYGFSKYIMAKHAQSSGNIYNLRLFAVFGKYEDWRVRFISNACCNAVMGLPVKINQNVVFDFACIEDLVRIVRWFINHKPQKHIYNVCSGKAVDLKSIAEKIIKISGKNLDIVIKNDGLGREYSGDNTLLLKELGGFDFTSLDSSIRDLYEWYEANKEIIEKDKL